MHSRYENATPSLCLDTLKNNGENHPKKCFWTTEKETRVKRQSAFEQLRPVEHLLHQ